MESSSPGKPGNLRARDRCAGARLPCGRVYRAVLQFAELASGARRAEEHDLVFLFVVVALDKVRLPAAGLGISTAPALDADELGGRHGQDDAATGREPKVAKGDSSGGQLAADDCPTRSFLHLGRANMRS